MSHFTVVQNMLLELVRLCCCFIQNVYLRSIYFLFCRVDSIMLVEEGFNMTSVDASDKMLKYALKSRWERRKEQAFDQWGNRIFHFVKTELSSLNVENT